MIVNVLNYVSGVLAIPIGNAKALLRTSLAAPLETERARHVLVEALRLSYRDCRALAAEIQGRWLDVTSDRGR